MTQPTVLLVDLGSAPNPDVNQHLRGFDPAQVHFVTRHENVYHREYKRKRLIDFDLIYQESYDEAFQKVIDFGAFKVEEDHSIAQLLMDSTGKSLWYYFRFMLLYRYRKIRFEHAVFQEVENLSSSYQKIILAHQSKALDQLLKQSNSIVSVYSPQQKQGSKEKLKGIFKFACLTISRFFVGFFSLGLLFKASKKHLFLYNAAAHQKVLSLKNFKIVKGDHISQYFQNYIETERDFISGAEYFPPSLAKAKDIKLKRSFIFSRFKRQFNIETPLYLQLLNPIVYFYAYRDIRKLKHVFKTLENTKLENYLDQSLVQLIQGFKRLCYFVAFRKAAVRSLLQLFRFKSIISNSEHDVKAKSIMEVAEYLGIETYGIQHGVIHYRHLHYCFSAEDARHKPFPNTTFLWGGYWKKVLLSFSNYAPQHLEVVGQLRTDIIPKLKNLEKKALFENKFDERYTVLYPSQPLYVGEEQMRKRLAMDFLNLTKSFPHLQFIVKPHPAEKDCEVFFNTLAKKLGTDNYQIINDDLYKLLAFSDLVLIYNSTVGTEAVYFQKPLVVMNYSNNDFSAYLKDNIAIEVNNYKTLSSTIALFAQNQLEIDKKSQDIFIRERAYKIDGKVAQRMVKKLRKHA